MLERYVEVSVGGVEDANAYDVDSEHELTGWTGDDVRYSWICLMLEIRCDCHIDLIDDVETSIDKEYEEDNDDNYRTKSTSGSLVIRLAPESQELLGRKEVQLFERSEQDFHWLDSNPKRRLGYE